MSKKTEYKLIKNFPTYRAGTDGTIWNKKNGEWIEMILDINAEGYNTVDLIGKSGKKYTLRVDHLILETFCGPPPGDFRYSTDLCF